MKLTKTLSLDSNELPFRLSTNALSTNARNTKI